jgi:GNAT superfamily N-acetyltransferase
LLKIRRFSENDATTLGQISNEALRDEIDRGMPVFTLERIISSSKRVDIRILIAEDEGEVVGFLTLNEGNIEAVPHISLVAVKESHRGRGVGKKLMKTAVEDARNTGRRKLKLFTRPWNKAMSKVCLDLGFVPEAYLRREYLDADIVLYSLFFE